ncbi:MAG: hypothetical protein AB1432_05495 [Bacteroidota bacterium]
MTTELREQIAAKGNSIPELIGGFWYLEAPQKVSYPYSVFSFIDDISSRDSVSKFEQPYLQINIYDEDGENVEILKEKMIAEFDDSEADFNLTDYFFDRIERQFVKPIATNIFQIAIQYKIDLTKK